MSAYRDVKVTGVYLLHDLMTHRTFTSSYL